LKRFLSPKEFVVAGLLNEGPCHGYELEQKIQQRGMRNWTQIGFSSIYHVLKKLKSYGYVSQSGKIVRGKLQQVYRLTPKGKKALLNQIHLSITTVGRGRGDFHVAISNTIGKPSEEIRTLLEQRIKNLKDHATRLEQLRENKIKSGTPDLPAITILFDHPIAILKSESDFLKSYKKKF